MKAAANQAVYYRNYRRARERALTKLAQMHPETYRDLLEKEKASDEQMGKKWLDINGTTALDELGVRPPATTTGVQATNQGSNAGDNGGEA